MNKLILIVTALALTLSAGVTMGADLIAGNPKNGANVVGTVVVSVAPPNLVVTYTITDPTWAITETHLHVALSPDAIPQSKGNPPPGQFAYSSSHEVEDTETEVIHTIPLTEVFPPDGVVPEVFFVAAHAVVIEFVPCPELVDCLPEEVILSVMHAVSDFEPDYENSYFVATISGDTCLDGIYDAWCVDTDRSIRPIGLGPYEYSRRQTPQQAKVYLSTEWIPLGLDTVLIDDHENLPLVNWILNNIAVRDDSPGCDGTYTYGDIQLAIWDLLGQPTVVGLGPYSECRAAEIIEAAENNPDGLDYMPMCGDDVGLIVLPYVYLYPEGYGELTGKVIKVASTAGDDPWPGYPGDPAYPGDEEFDAVFGGIEAPDPLDYIKYQQPFIIMVPVICCYSDETAWAGTPVTPSMSWPDEDNDGYKYEFPGNNWAMYFTYPEDAVYIPATARGNKK